MKLRLMALAATTLVALLTSGGMAQDRLLAEMYGQGVHTFYRGNYTAARDQLDSTILAGYADPRAYYFRAFAKMRTGDTGGAESDIRMGADLEVSGAGTYDIGRALERVQGPDRLRFEEWRRESMIAAMRSKALLREMQPVVPAPIREPFTVPVPPPPILPVPAPQPGDADDDPFTDDAGDDEVLEKPREELPADDSMFDDLGGDDPAPGDSEPALNDDDAGLFDDAPAADEPPAAEIDAGDDNLFGDGDDDIFGGGEPLESKAMSDEDFDSLFEE